MNNFELPSIVVDGGVLKPKRLDKNEFRSSIPVTYSNTSVDLFGVKENGTELDEDLDDLFSRASLRTPREIKERNKRGKHVNSRYDSKYQRMWIHVYYDHHIYNNTVPLGIMLLDYSLPYAESIYFLIFKHFCFKV